MYIDWILFLISICLTSWSFFSILIDWDQTVLRNFYSVWAGTSMAISILITFALLLYFKKLSETLKHWSYNCWISILYARSCHVWVESVSNQQIIKECGQIITLGAPLAGNITRVSYIHERPLCSAVYNSWRLSVPIYGGPRVVKMGDDVGNCYFCSVNCSFDVYSNGRDRTTKTNIVFHFIVN